MNAPDPYLGNPPQILWDMRLSGNVAGLRPTSLNGEPVDNWMSCERILERRGMGRAINGKTVIELGCGRATDFRDYCVRNAVKKYVGVDLFTAPSKQETMDGTEVSRIQADALQYLMTQPNESAIIAGFVFFCDELLEQRYMRKLGIEPRKIIELMALHVARVMEKGKSLIIFPGDLGYDAIFKQMGVTREEFGMVYTKSNAL